MQRGLKLLMRLSFDHIHVFKVSKWRKLSVSWQKEGIWFEIFSSLIFKRLLRTWDYKRSFCWKIFWEWILRVSKRVLRGLRPKGKSLRVICVEKYGDESLWSESLIETHLEASFCCVEVFSKRLNLISDCLERDLVLSVSFTVFEEQFCAWKS